MHGMQEVARSTRVGSIVLSYAEFDTYEYLPCGSAAVTLIRKAVVLLFLKGEDRENRRKNKKSNPQNCATTKLPAERMLCSTGEPSGLANPAPKRPSRTINKTIAEWLSSGKQVAADGSNITLNEILARFWVYAESYYRSPDGKPTTELDSLRYAFRPLLKLYGNTEAASFGPRCLRAVQRNMVEIGWCRNNVNRSLSRIKMLFKWAVSQELLQSSVYQALITVPGLRKGRSDAHETEPTKPVPQEHIDAIKPYVNRHMWTIIQLQLLTAARPSEILKIRPCDIDRGGKIWVCSPAAHKTAHHGHDRKIYFGPRAQELLSPFLFRPAQAYCFSPAEAYAERLAYMHANRRLPSHAGTCQVHAKKTSRNGGRENVIMLQRIAWQ